MRQTRTAVRSSRRTSRLSGRPTRTSAARTVGSSSRPASSGTRAQPEQVRAADPVEDLLDGGAIGEYGALELQVPERERRRVGDAVDGRRGQQHREQRPGPDRRQAGRGAPDGAGPADGRLGVRLARRGPGRRCAADRRALGHRGRSLGRRWRGRAACVPLEGELDDPEAHVGEGVAARRPASSGRG